MDPEELDALLGPLQRHNQHQEIAKTNKELQEISSRLAKTEKEENSLPQCPYCGGRIPVGFAKCKNCASDLIWFHGFPGKVGEETTLQRMVLALEQKAKASRIKKAAATQIEAAQEAKFERGPNIEGKILLVLLAVGVLVFMGLLLWVNLYGPIDIGL